MSEIIADGSQYHEVQCATCKHRLSAFSCKAYDDIPGEILSGAATHNEVATDQKGEYVYTKVL